MRVVPIVPCQVHIMVCANTRPPGGLPCCGGLGDAIFEALKGWTLDRRLVRDVWVTRTNCLGFCHQDGVTVALYFPRSDREPLFLQGVQLDDLETLIEETVVVALSG